MSLRPPHDPVHESPYDGHDNYRERLKPPPWRVRGPLLLRNSLAFGVALTFMRWTYNWFQPGATPVVLVAGIAACVVWLIVMVAASVWLSRDPERPVTIWREGVAALVFVFGFLLPVLL